MAVPLRQAGAEGLQAGLQKPSHGLEGRSQGLEAGPQAGRLDRLLAVTPQGLPQELGNRASRGARTPHFHVGWANSSQLDLPPQISDRRWARPQFHL